MRINESKFRSIIAEEMRHFHEPSGDPRRIANIVKEFCEDKVSSAYEHQVTYGDEEDEDSDDFDDGVYREFVDEFKAIIEAGEEPEDSNFFKTAVRDLGEEMARNALDDAIAQTED